MAFLDELGRNVLQRYLIGRRNIIKVGVLDQGIHPVMPDRTVREAEYGLGKATVIECAQRAFAVGVIQLSKQACSGCDLVFEIIPEQPRRSFSLAEIRLFRRIVAIFDGARDLHRVETVADVNSACDAICFGTRLHILQRTDIRVQPQVPALGRGKADTGCMSQPGHRIIVLIPLLEVDACAVRESCLDAGDQVAFTTPVAALSIVAALVFERVVQIHACAIGMQIVRADLSAEAEIAVRDFGIDTQAI